MNTNDKYELPPLPDCSLYISGQPGLCMINIDHLYELLTDYAREAIEVALRSQEYTSAIGEAGQAYLDQFKNAHALPAEFRWSELWAVMCVAANKGRTDVLRLQDSERLDFITSKPGVCYALVSDDSGRWALTDAGMSPVAPDQGFTETVGITSIVDPDMWKSSPREAIDHARRV